MKQNLDDAVSLFPFLDIMASLIGILVLLITAVTLAQISRNVEDTADARSAAQAQLRVQQYRLASRDLAADQRERERLEELLRQIQELQQQRDETAAELQRLENEQQRREDRVEQQEAIARYQQQIEQARERLQTLHDQRAELLEELEELQRVPDPDVRIVPSGTGYDLVPTFIECTADSLVLHDGPDAVRIAVRGLADNAVFQQLLDDVKSQPKGTVIFLIRPEGVATYNIARNIARRQYVTNGKLAVAGEGKLDLNLFQQGATP
jgi:seryl-tRNA synthetase